MKDMFCFQCEQTAKGTGCEVSGVCGKTPPVSDLQDKLVGACIGLAKAVKKTAATEATDACIKKALFTTVTNVSFDEESLKIMVDCVDKMKAELDPAAADYDMAKLWDDNEDIRSLKTLILLGVKGVAAYAHHAAILGYKDPVVDAFFYEALDAVGSDLGMGELLPLVLKTGEINLACMALLDKANTETYGTPVPTEVPLTIEKGPFIIITGHDLHDLKLLLEQTEGKGVNIYTHGEMLPAHAYPELKKYSHLKGNFGTAWQNQQKEFASVPAPVLFTTNCIMPVKDSYSDRIFTTDMVQYPGMIHVGKEKDFAPVIAKALELGGYPEDKEMTGINGGKTLLTGFGHGTVLGVADKVIAAVKAGDIKHFFLVGGCDGAKTGRNYYTEFVEKTPADTVVLTLACGKYRFNDLDLGTIGGLPRLMDMGQCNDAYSAIQVAVALAGAFECGVNDLPLSMVLSWYEQKAVCILLTLLHLGIKNILLGPSLPAFISPNVLNVLVENYNIGPITTPEADMAKLLG
ncbi:hydroxylamine reductase [Acetobacterium malicum]|uniref:hydroxylamine reductase n=1 Tax=Acetobacterium malicum TaxID=52692 RepID=UPI000418BECD|nr:hydroxylamine reductase [Acetobacterium dehalogenans]